MQHKQMQSTGLDEWCWRLGLEEVEARLENVLGLLEVYEVGGVPLSKIAEALDKLAEEYRGQQEDEQQTA